MTVIHAFRRTRPHTVEPLAGGKKFKFVANKDGEFVCDVTDEKSAKRLLELSEGYRAHGTAKVEPEDDESDPNAVSPFVLTVDGADGAETTLDLRTLDSDALFAFCKENEIPAHPSCKEDTLRQKIVDFFKVE